MPGRFRPGPRDLTAIAAMLCSGVLFGLVYLALSLPQLDRPLHATGEQLQVMDDDGRWRDVVALLDSQGSALPMPSTLAVEEPDFLPTWTDYNALMAAQSPRIDAITAGGARLHLADGSTLPVSSVPRRLGDLGWAFWMQLAFGLAALTIGFGVWAFRPRTLDSAILLVTAIGFAAGTWSASLYSTRDLLMPEGLFRGASIVNHGGALLFDCAMAALLWHYPRPLGRLPVPLLLAFAWATLWTLDTLQVVESLSLGFYLWLLLVFFVALAFARAQWLRAEGDPLARAALKWLLLSFLVGSGTFTALQIVPRVLSVDVPVPQSVLSGAFLIVYLGLAAGISRYQLFHLERWWRATWSWLLGGVLVLVVDALLLWWLHLESGTSLAIAIAISGWLYFPLRQWLLGRLLGVEPRGAAIEPSTVRSVFDLSASGALAPEWPRVLERVFRPREITLIEGEHETGIDAHGLLLHVPALVPGHVLRLSGCEGGARLFRPDDVRVATDLHGIAVHAQTTTASRAQGAQLERARIRRDLHDDLGARLLSILHSDNPQDMQEEARVAIRDLRQMLVTLEERPLPLADLLVQVVGEARERCGRENLRFSEEQRLDANPELNARQCANITRIVREAVTNAIKHAGARLVAFSAETRGGDLLLSLADDGSFSTDALARQGRGHHIVRSRVDELRGDVAWERNEAGGCTLRVRLPLAAPTGLDTVS